MMITRRSILRGLFAAPAVIAIGSLMPIRGIIMPMREPVVAWADPYTDVWILRWNDGSLSEVSRKALEEWPNLMVEPPRPFITYKSPADLLEKKLKRMWGAENTWVEEKIIDRQTTQDWGAMRPDYADSRRFLMRLNQEEKKKDWARWGLEYTAG